MMAATIATKSGTAPFSIPVNAEDTCRSAKGNMHRFQPLGDEEKRRAPDDAGDDQ
jgi:hypothetical protein